jgi:hypothetical protein
LDLNLTSTDSKQFAFLYDALDENIIHCFEYLKETINKKTEDRLKYLPYDQFLNTLYWKIISRYKRRLMGVCDECGTKYHLQTHHLDYTFRGIEYRYLDSMRVLCRNCHDDTTYKDKNDAVNRIIKKVARAKQFSTIEEKQKRKLKTYIESICR